MLRSGLRKILQGKRFGMVPAVERFEKIFFRESLRDVAIVAGRGGVMAGAQPGIILFLHHMAVDASLGIITQVGEPFRILKGKPANADQNADSDTEENSKPRHHALLGRLLLIHNSS